jgi:hypothetical protein
MVANIIRTVAAIGENVGKYRKGVVFKALFTGVVEEPRGAIIIDVCCRDSLCQEGARQ